MENDTFFEHDRDLEFVSIQCQDDGYFKVPDEWFKCVKGMIIYFIIQFQVLQNKIIDIKPFSLDFPNII